MATLNKRNWSSGFEQVPNDLIERGSFKATGLWAFLAKLPDNWEFSVRGISAVRTEGIDAIRVAVKELEELGYLRRERMRSEGGKLGAGDWVISKSPMLEKPTQVKPTQVNPTQQHTTPKHTKSTTNSTKNIPDECYALAELLKENILMKYPNNKIASTYRHKWAEDIDKMVRIEGREYRQIHDCIVWTFNMSDFWQRQIWSGANLRKHYDKISAQAQSDMPKIRELKKKQLAHLMAMDKITLEQYREELAKLT